MPPETEEAFWGVERAHDPAMEKSAMGSDAAKFYGCKKGKREKGAKKEEKQTMEDVIKIFFAVTEKEPRKTTKINILFSKIGNSIARIYGIK